MKDYIDLTQLPAEKVEAMVLALSKNDFDLLPIKLQEYSNSKIKSKVIIDVINEVIGDLEYIKNNVTIPVLGLNLNDYNAPNHKIICTKLTAKKYTNLEVCACSRLAGIIEDNIFDIQTLKRRIAKTLDRAEICENNIVLGCTHYPFLLPAMRRAVADRAVEFIDPSPAVARRVVQLLDAGDLRAASDHHAELRFVSFAEEEYRQRIENFARRLLAEQGGEE